MENYKRVTRKSSRGHLQEVVVYESFQLNGFDWENLDVLDRGSLTRGGLTGRFDCFS